MHGILSEGTGTHKGFAFTRHISYYPDMGIPRRIICHRFLVAVTCIMLAAVAELYAGGITDLPGDVIDDYTGFYSRDNLLMLGAGLVVGGVMANTLIDERVNEWYQDEMRSNGTDDFSAVVKPFGDAVYTLPLYAGVYLLDLLLDVDGPVGTDGEGGEPSLRPLRVGAPARLAGQRILGGSRPDEENGSNWQPFSDNNAVSGHSFIGAVPFINAAKMVEFVPAKCMLYAASGLCAYSRVNDEAHYLSQALLGWWMAYLAASVVDQNISADAPRVRPVYRREYSGAAWTVDF